ncbi:hypothetical protein TNCV_2679771 [Trichonephila clavipes]|nr:hypothetical protein TNCV_2679771 [Trichonephila clavipes]
MKVYPEGDQTAAGHKGETEDPRPKQSGIAVNIRVVCERRRRFLRYSEGGTFWSQSCWFLLRDHRVREDQDENTKLLSTMPSDCGAKVWSGLS